ncbi:MAG TPA: hypothetical protein VFE32_01175 [Puia sp.]|jgi:hypothetical protein|nr:hypothetical protein [Puia sp.]
MDSVNTMSTISQVLDTLRLKNMDLEFRWTPDGFTPGRGKYYQPEQLEIIKVFRFEGESDPSDMAILYVLRTRDGVIGYSLDAYGAYSSHEKEEGYDNFIRRVPECDHTEQLLFEL